MKVLLLWVAGAVLGGCAALAATPCGAPGRLCAPIAPITSTAAAGPQPTPLVAPAGAGTSEAGTSDAGTSDAGTPDAATQGAMPGPAAPVRIGLLLPLGSATLGPAAASVRAGFLAAYQREPDGLALAVVETGDSAQETLLTYARVQEQQDIIVGPLARAAVTALAASALVRKPTIALNRPEAGAETMLPPRLLVIGLSLEDEARQAAAWAAAEHPDGTALVLAAGAPWQRRAAHAFLEQWQRGGRSGETAELSALEGLLSEGELAQLRARVQETTPALLFGALDAGQAQQLRAALGNRIPLYGTSSLNPGGNRARPELDGVRLLDLPWQLQPDHPAVMAYPQPAAVATADMARLYALGIDAFRIARALALDGAGPFGLDGVTGQLSVSFGQGPARFERTEQPAVYRDGAPAPLAAPFGPP